MCSEFHVIRTNRFGSVAGRPAKICQSSLFSDQMYDGQDWMSQQHTRSGVTHDLADPISHLRLVAMDLAFRACRFVRSKWTIRQPSLCIVEQLPAITADFGFRPMMGPAIDPNHGANRLSFDSRRHGYGFRGFDWQLLANRSMARNWLRVLDAAQFCPNQCGCNGQDMKAVGGWTGLEWAWQLQLRPERQKDIPSRTLLSGWAAQVRYSAMQPINLNP